VEGLRRLVALTPFRCGPHATEVVRSLREGGLRTAVISNTIGEPGSALRPLLHTMGFDPWVEAYVFSDEHPWTKPNPAIFGEALERLEVPAERAVHVGDGWVDVEGARRAGLRAAVLFTGLQQYGHRYHSLFLPAGSTAPASDYRIDRLDELPDLAERLLGAGKSG
jgi:phosphoglycolate phosphatase